MRRIGLIVALFFLIITGLYFLMADSLPPRSPYKIARSVSGLHISNDVSLSEFNDYLFSEPGTPTNGFIHIEFTLTTEQLDNLIIQAKEKSFDVLPINDQNFRHLTQSSSNGYYLLKQNRLDPLNYSLTVIDTDQKKLVVDVSDS